MTALAAPVAVTGCTSDDAATVEIPSMRAAQPPAVEHAVRIDFGEVTDPHTDWTQVADEIDATGATTVDLDAGRVEFTAFDWSGHTDAAAEPGTDHLAVAAQAVHAGPDGRQRDVNLVVDALVPRWIAADPSIAGVDAEGQRSAYVPSAASLHDGAVGDRLVAFVRDLGARYDPHQISISELMFRGYTFGAADLALFRRMTGARDWPRRASGAIDTASPLVRTWRAQVIADLLGRMRAALDEAQPDPAHRVRLALDVRVDWDAPAHGRTEDGGDYRILLQGADHLVLWAYAGTSDEHAAAVRRLTAGLARSGLDLSRLTVSIGAWEGDETAQPQRAVPAAELADEVRAAQTHGISSVGVVPLRLLDKARLTALGEVWGAGAGSSPSALSRAAALSRSDTRRVATARAAVRHSVSLGFETVMAPESTWRAVTRRLAATRANEVHLSAGRVEWTPFVWSEHPDVAADGTADHLRAAIDRVRRDPAGRTRRVDLMIDALVPAWIERDPSIAGVDARGGRASYTPSASALYDGVVGRRFVAYAGELARRYRPDQITFTELKFDDETFGSDDLRLFRRLTGARDWPRTADGRIDVDAPVIGTWRSQVLAHLLGQVRAELTRVEAATGKHVDLATDVAVDWDHPARGRPDAGQRYDVLARSVDKLVLWAYIGSDGRPASDIRRLTAALRSSGVPTSRFSVSVGLWGRDDSTTRPLPPAELGRAVRDAQTNGVRDVNVTPVSLMRPAHWRALRRVWARSR